MPSREVEEMLAEAAERDGQTADANAGAQIRLLQCWECKTLEVLPDYPPSANPAQDATLHYVDEKHGGGTENPHYRALHRVPQVVWEDRKAKRQIVKDMWSTESMSGFTPGYYDIKDQLREDATQCWKDHRRPTREHPCVDYRSSAKLIKPPTVKDRKQAARELDMAGMRNKIDLDRMQHDVPSTFLCSFCPYQTVVEFVRREQRGEA